MKILYLGDTFEHSTSAHRANALRRLGHEVHTLHPRGHLPSNRIIGGLSVRIGYGIFSPLMLRIIQKYTQNKKFDLAWVDAGPELGPDIYNHLRSAGMKIINYNIDDPFGVRDGKKWKLYRQGVKFHDLSVVMRKINITEAKKLGAKNPLRVFMSYDRIAHAPLTPSPVLKIKWESDVSFIGTWMPERGPFLEKLLSRGIPLVIYGDRWQKAPEWEQLKKAWRGTAIYGKDYVAACQFSKISLGLLSKGNRDEHTTRSTEIPYIEGAAFCAQKTPEHLQLYDDRQEAMFWSTPEECAEQCELLLNNEDIRNSIVKKAKLKVTKWRQSNDDVCKIIIDHVKGAKTEHPLISN